MQLNLTEKELQIVLECLYGTTVTGKSSLALGSLIAKIEKAQPRDMGESLYPEDADNLSDG